MNSLFNIPFPRPSLKSYTYIATSIGIVISFILVVFQPFGTDSFEHPNKLWILLGYGFVSTLTILIFYILSKKLIHKKREANWNIVLEVMDLFIVLLLSLLLNYIYSVLIFGGSLRIKGMIYFILNAATVAVLPVSAYLLGLYFSWKGVKRSYFETNANQTGTDTILTLRGTNKSDLLETSSDDILMAKAQDNYVMLFIKNDGKIQRHIIRSTLKLLKEQLVNDNFIQVHRSYIVNGTKIESVIGNKSKATLQLKGYDKKIPLSRSAYDAIKKIA